MAEGCWTLLGFEFDGLILFLVLFVMGSVVVLFGGKLIRRNTAGAMQEKEGKGGHVLMSSKSSVVAKKE